MRGALLLVLALIAFPACFLNGMEVVNSGIVFAGKSAGENSVAKRFPFSWKLTKKNSLNKVLAERLSQYRGSNFSVLTQDLGSIKGDAVSLAFVVDLEKNYVSKLSGFNKYKLEVFIVAEAMFFDFKSKSILASHPFIISYSQICDVPPDEKQIESIFEKIYGRDAFVVGSENLNIFDFFIEVISKITPERMHASSIGVSKVNILPEASDNVQKMGFSQEEAQEFIANLFGAYIYKNFEVPVIPYSYEGSEIFYVMADGYVEADKLTNQLLLHPPRSTYKIDISLRKLLSKIAEENRGIRTYFFGASYRVSVRDIEDEIVFNRTIGKGNSSVYIAGEEKNWPFDAEYMNVLIMLTQSAGQRLKNDEKFSEFPPIIQNCK